MQKEAELHAEEDKKAKEAIEVRNNADNLAYQCEKQLKDLGDKLPAEKKTEIEGKIAAVREALKGSDTDAIKVAYDDLQNKFQSVSEELYKQAAASQGGQPGGAGPGPEPQGEPQQGGAAKNQGDVVDAEFEVVDEDKKK
jgi:molecular chaperone DnaK